MDAAIDSTMMTATTDTREELIAELGTTTGLWENGGESTAGDVAGESTGDDSGGIGAANVSVTFVSKVHEENLALYEQRRQDPYAVEAAREQTR